MTIARQCLVYKPSISMDEKKHEALPPADTTVDDAMSEATIKRAAALAVQGVTARQTMAKQLGVSNYFAAKIMASDRFKQLVEEMGEDAVALSKAELKNNIAKLSKKAVKAIEHNLDKHNLQAAITVLRAMGVETAEKKDGDGKSNFTLVLAGNKPEPKPVVVVSKGDDEEKE